jgi:ABC-type polar amino acid transport system ATPase subunit
MGSDSETGSFSFTDGIATPDYQESVEDAINVLIVGETQHGKSTLIRQIGHYAGVTDLDIKVGRGNKSCTTTVGQYTFSVALQRYQLLDLKEKPITKLEIRRSLQVDD